jgi:plastocyanin
MMRFRKWAAAAGLGAAVTVVLFAAGSASADDKKWVTLKGRVEWPAAAAVPQAKNPDVKTDKEHCLSKGQLVYEDLIVDPKTRGVKNVWVYLKPATGDDFPPADINPALAKAPPKEHVIDQPCCQFVPRILAARAGDTLLVKNSAPVPHNINYNADNESFNVTVPSGGKHQPKAALAAQKSPILFKCDIHPWMSGRIMVFDHPYFAVTDANGNFEIKGAPTGNYRIFYRHENGYHMGRAGAKGFPIEIKDEKGGTMELKPLDLELPKPTN